MKKNKYIKVLLAFCIVITSISVMSACADTSENTTSAIKIVSSPKTQYSFDSNTRTLTISIEGKMENAPWKDIEYPENIVLKKRITSIRDYAFSFDMEGNTGKRRNYYDRIKTVSIPDTVEYIGTSAFDYCKKLKKINIPDSVTSLGDMCVFNGCESLNEITIPGSIKKLPYGTFYDCKNLKKVTLKNGIQKISQEVFFNCKNLSSINIPDTVTEIDDAFSHCNSLKSIKLPKNIKTIKSQTFYSCKKMKEVTIQNNVTEIEDRAFDNCKSLKSITIPASVKKIGKMAFGYVLKYQPSGDESYIDVPIKDFTIKGYKGTAAEKYAKKNGFKFVAA